MPSASVAVRTAPTSWPAAVFSGTLRAAVGAENAGKLLKTWKTSETPYMGWREIHPKLVPLLRGPWPLPEELGRPGRTPALVPSARDDGPGANASVPSWSQPVQG